MVEVPAEAVAEEQVAEHCHSSREHDGRELRAEDLPQEPPDDREERVHQELPGHFGKLNEEVVEVLPEDQTYAVSGDCLQHKKQVIITMNSDLLTPAEAKQHQGMVQQAMQVELATWHKQCFEKRLRRKARNIINSRWVLKGKVTGGWGLRPCRPGHPSQDHGQKIRGP